MTRESTTKVKFVSTISKIDDKRIIIISKDYHSELDKLNPKQVKITIDDEFNNGKLFQGLKNLQVLRY